MAMTLDFAKCYLTLTLEVTDFSVMLWSFVDPLETGSSE